MAAPGGGEHGGADVVGAGYYHLGGGEGGRWPANVGPSGGFGGVRLCNSLEHFGL